MPVTTPAASPGGVPDWIHVWFYGPTFNLADLWLRGGLLVSGRGSRVPGSRPVSRAENTAARS